ncbi:unnamed protein product [Echinostoma caproni]|uniref:Reverse transcriptase n=1 Tax=Echinostoma caproni TaxID=27848 RepID=A0A183B6C5_9TREM|nr:unnamed protein product [Echinostoma caproni]
MVISPEISYDLISGIDFLWAFQLSTDVSQDTLIPEGKLVSLREHAKGGPDWVFEVHPVDLQRQVSRPLCRADPYTSSQQMDRIHALLIKHQAAFAWEGVPLGRTKTIQHHITTQGVSPVRQHPRWVPVRYRAELGRVDDFFVRTSMDNLRGHSMKLFKPRARTLVRQCSFTHRVIPLWNSLPQEVGNLLVLTRRGFTLIIQHPPQWSLARTRLTGTVVIQSYTMAPTLEWRVTVSGHFRSIKFEC